MAANWIVTTRKVENGVVKDADKDALASFRIAKAKLPELTQPDDLFLQSVKWIEDTDAFIDFSNIPPDVDPDTLQGTQRLFLALYQAMKSASDTTKGDVLFFIHGFDYNWIDNLRHLRKLDDLYVNNPYSPISSIVYFSWPSFGDITNYKKDQRNALISGAALGRLFVKMNEFYEGFFSRREDGKKPTFCGKKIHLATHSMGNQVLEEMVRAMNNADWLRKNFFEELVMLHADADWSSLETGHPLASLPDYAERIHIYNHSNDNALLISETTKNIGKKRLGRHGPRDKNTIPPRTLIVDCTTAKNENPELVGEESIDSSGVMGQISNVIGQFADSAKEVAGCHWGYLFRKQVIEDLIQVFKGTSASQITTREPKGSAGNLHRIKKT